MAFQPADTTIANLALGHLGQGTQIQSLDTDASAQGQACRQFYYSCRDEVLRAFPWPFATKFAQLALAQNMPTSEFLFAYRYPSDCLKIRRIPSGLRMDNRQSRIVYKISSDDQGLLILTDWQNAVQSSTQQPVLVPDIEYTFQMYNSAFWPADFQKALALYLASEISTRLTKGDPFRLGDKALARYQQVLAEARGNAMNEEQVDMLPESEFVRAREGYLWNQRSFPLSDWSPFSGGFSVQ